MDTEKVGQCWFRNIKFKRFCRQIRLRWQIQSNTVTDFIVQVIRFVLTWGWQINCYFVDIGSMICMLARILNDIYVMDIELDMFIYWPTYVRLADGHGQLVSRFHFIDKLRVKECQIFFSIDRKRMSKLHWVMVKCFIWCKLFQQNTFNLIDRQMH